MANGSFAICFQSRIVPIDDIVLDRAEEQDLVEEIGVSVEVTVGDACRRIALAQALQEPFFDVSV